MVSDPVDNLSRIVHLWNLGIEESVLRSAVDLCSREKMIAKIPGNRFENNKRVTVRKDRGRLFSRENTSYIKKAIHDKLRHDFGYEY